MTKLLKKSLHFLLTILVTFTISQAHSETITSAEFVAELERIYKFAADRPPVEVSEAEEEIFASIAECMNISKQQLISSRESINAGEVGLEALNQCKAKLPATIQADVFSVDYSSLPELQSYNQCVNKVQSELYGFDLAEVLRCQNQVTQ